MGEKNLNKLLSFTLCIVIFFSMPAIALADSVSLYSNIDDSNTYCNILIDVMRSDIDYDPYNEYVVVRAGEYDYRIYFGENLNGSELVYYRYQPTRQSIPASLTRGTASNLNINKNGYYYVGNVPGALASAQAEQYKLGAILTVAAIVILILVLFKLFRKSEGRKTKFYTVR